MTVADIIAMWPAPHLRNFASDVKEGVECVKRWRLHNSIPAGAIEAVVQAAERRGFRSVTREAILAEAARTRRKRKLLRRRNNAARMNAAA